MSAPRPIVHGLAAAGLALAANLLLLAGLEALRGSDGSPRRPPAERRLALLRGAEAVPTREQPGNEPVPEVPRLALPRILPRPSPPDLAPPPDLLVGLALEASARPRIGRPEPVLDPMPERLAPQQPADARGAAPVEQSSVDPMSASGPAHADGVDQPPRERPGNVPPRFPSSARRRGQEGTVEVRLSIDATGCVEGVRVLTLEGPESFAEAVLRVAPTWRFEPAVHRGRRVPVIADKTLHFRIEDRPR